MAREYCAEAHNGLEAYLEEIQSRLLDIGSAIATPLNNSPEHLIGTYIVHGARICLLLVLIIFSAKTRFPGTHVSKLENWIDHLDAQLPPLKNFILPVSFHSLRFIKVCI